MGFRITSWNVNGIRNPFSYQPWREKRTFPAMFDTLEADIVVLQETKIQRKDLRDDMVLVPGWDVFFSLPKYKKGYSGVAVYTRSAKCCPIRAEEGITGVLCPSSSSVKYRDLPPERQIGGYPTASQLPGSLDPETLDSEGRCVVLEFPAFVLIGVYSPAMRDETRTEFRSGFLDALDARVRNLVAVGKQVVLCGDLNVIRSELDTAGLHDALRKEGMTVEDFLSMPPRRLFNHLVFGGQVVGPRDEGRSEPVLYDLCREFHPTRRGMYTCWETKKNARPGNFGSRIDYVLCSAGISSWFEAADIQEGLMGSDHCPVYAVISDVVKTGDSEVHVADLLNPPGMFVDGQRVRDISAKDMLASSAKLIPEFDRRQSIRDMFFKKIAAPQPPTQPDLLTDPIPASRSSSSQASSAEMRNNTAAASSSKRPSDSNHATAGRPPPKRNKTTKEDLSSTPTTTTTNTTKSGAAALSQSSLAGFFKPKTPPVRDPPNPSIVNKQTNGASQSTTTKRDCDRNPNIDDDTAAGIVASSADSEDCDAQQQLAADDPPSQSRSQSQSQPPDAVGDKTTTTFVDPIKTKESWAKLLGKRVVPKCEHGDDCVSLVTKKQGINCGRSFYICPRPLGPTGDKEQGTEFRCRTFVWSSDWNGK